MANKKNNDDEYYSSNLRRHPETTHQAKPNHSLRKKICAILLVVCLVVIYGGTAYASHMLHSAKNTLNDTYTKTNVKKLRDVSDVIKNKKPFSLLILGTDTGDLGRSDTGRTDTLIVATVNPAKKRVTLTSIPRDTEVRIAGSDNSYDKINTAYTIGGVSTAIKTVQNTLHVPIDYYVLVNMGGLRKIVDAVGGVTVTPPLTFKYEDANVTKGQKVKLNGKQALAYSRMRYDDPEGDYGRQKRQKQIISAIIDQAISISSITRFQELLKSIESNMQTDLTYNDMLTIVSNYKDAAKSVDSYTVHGDDAMLSGSSYQIASKEEKEKASKRIRNQLNLEPSTEEFTNPIESDSSAGTASQNNGQAADQGQANSGTYDGTYAAPSYQQDYSNQQPADQYGYYGGY
ncbi:MAG TPA: LCP family protein [Candidatus Ligilactobacillus excrementipullorum]|nr:LCP family protein [Candidatus Ligilactobacillus excrementipullorum]